MTEKQLQDKIVRYLKKNGIYYVKIHNNGYMRRGIPDLLICYNGKFIGAELKSEKGRPTKEQLYELSNIKESGGQSSIIRTLAELVELLEGDTE